MITLEAYCRGFGMARRRGFRRPDVPPARGQGRYREIAPLYFPEPATTRNIYRRWEGSLSLNSRSRLTAPRFQRDYRLPSPGICGWGKPPPPFPQFERSSTLQRASGGPTSEYQHAGREGRATLCV